MSILLLYYFNPSLTSMRAMQNASNWERVRKQLGIPRVSLGSLSEAPQVFDPALVRPHLKGREAEALANLTAVAGSVFAVLPRMAWALWMDEQHRGVKLYLQFHVAKSLPADALLTPAACSEPAQPNK